MSPKFLRKRYNHGRLFLRKRSRFVSRKISTLLFEGSPLPVDRLSLYRRNRVYYWLSEKCNRSGWRIFFVSALFLFGPAAILNLLNGTAINLHLTSIAQRVLSFVGISVRSADQTRSYPLVPFFSDYGTMIFLSLLYPIHTVILLKFWDSIPVVFERLYDEGIIPLSDSARLGMIREFNSRFNNRVHKLSAFLISTAFTSWIYLYGRSQLEWWGSVSYGVWGFLAYIIVSLCVWYQLFLHNHKGLMAISLIRRVFHGQRINLDLYHPDKHYGLASLARVLMLIYATTVIHTISLYVVLQFGFLHPKFDFMLVILISFFIVFVPIFHIGPYLLLRRHINGLIAGELTRIRALLRQNYQVLQSMKSKGASEIHPSVQNIWLLNHLYETIDTMPRHPYPMKRLRLALFSYVLPLVPIGLKFYEMLLNNPKP
jgi:hypothetical protein